MILEELQVANVTFVLKKGDRNVPSNHRDVTLTNKTYKFYGEMISKIFVSTTNILILYEQAGFYKG